MLKDFLDLTGVGSGGFRGRMTGGCMFGYIDGLRGAGYRAAVADGIDQFSVRPGGGRRRSGGSLSRMDGSSRGVL